MGKVGITIKKIRKIKGMSQKQVYSGIVSRSFANRFESGSNDIQSEKLFKILNNLAVTPNEFQFINNDYELPLVEKLIKDVYVMYNNHSFSALAKWISKHKKEEGNQEKYVVAYAEILLFTFDHATVPVTKSMNVLIEHLLEEKTWTLQEMRMVKMLIPIFANKKDGHLSIKDLTNKFEQNCQNYLVNERDPFHISDELVSFYSILFQNFLNKRDYLNAQRVYNNFSSVQNSYLTLEGKILLKFWLAIYGLYFGNFDKAEKDIVKLQEMQNLFPNEFELNMNSVLTVRRKDAVYYRQSIGK
ncbi:helix-turn-helix domain-containing protein [Ligilactobacillus acidipiscis]|uniref:Transcription regulator n=1 Tax=Ligilactobacillus acidipiscis TaxID=89059 RepID=A0A0R2K4Y5_9LACO|nr:helix-turn-helix transcriptional regulator [Ligilactobacillus acidipiscis]KRN81610.1 transcription regulator [Ligilactobacillus acidipiscis]